MKEEKYEIKYYTLPHVTPEFYSTVFQLENGFVVKPIYFYSLFERSENAWFLSSNRRPSIIENKIQNALAENIYLKFYKESAGSVDNLVYWLQNDKDTGARTDFKDIERKADGIDLRPSLNPRDKLYYPKDLKRMSLSDYNRYIQYLTKDIDLGDKK